MIAINSEKKKLKKMWYSF